MTPIQKAFKENRIIRRKWSGIDSRGRQLLCLYTALLGDPEARPNSCPADLCPEWIAHLLPWIDDTGSEEHWPQVVRRVVDLAEMLPHVPRETEWRVRALIVREAMKYTKDGKVLEVCERVANLCDRRVRGEIVTDEGMENALAVAARASRSTAATEAAKAAARAAARAAAARAAAAAEAAAAGATAGATAEAAWAAEAAAWAAAEATPGNTVTDRLIDAILDEIEASVRIKS